jgi:hypothetical protein
MSGVSYLFLYIPICLAIMLVLEGCRSDDPGRIVRRSLANFGTLTLVLGVGGALVWTINRFF